ncbi:hypothetical protein [Croceibacterium aestuarii]|uniref:hypothetical protein n=1 Tax=Croceibacterium aestuarii TaxID=3064139 RepID=UPI00272E3C64|nr:hypothetical protein [Croceibacterium sp. D39]
MRDDLEQLRICAMLTGLAVVALAFAQIVLGWSGSDYLPMVAAAVAGFELALFAGDQIRKRRHG